MSTDKIYSEQTIKRAHTHTHTKSANVQDFYRVLIDRLAIGKYTLFLEHERT